MVYSKLSGGLGNQMFQFAMGYTLAKRNNCLQMLDISTLISTNTKDATERNFELGVFDLQVGFLSAAEREKKIQKSNGFLARHFGFSKLYQLSESGFRYNPAYSQTKYPRG